DEARYACQQTLREGFVRDWPLEVRHVDGRLTSVIYNASVRHDDDDRVNGIVAAIRPVLTSPARDAIPPDADALKFAALVVSGASLFAIAIGLAGLAGWLLDTIPDAAATRPHSMVTLAACGCALWLLRYRDGRPPTALRARIGRTLALLVAISGLTGVLEYSGLGANGQIMPITALNYLLIGLALLWLDAEVVAGRHHLQVVPVLAFVVNTTASIALIDFVLRSHATRFATPRGAVAQFVLAVALVCARTRSGVGALIVSRSFGGILARRLWPAAVGVQLLIGMASWRAHT